MTEKTNNSYPQLAIDLSKVAHNAKEVLYHCNAHGVDVTAVIKGCGGNIEVARALITEGVTSLASSRMDQLEALAAHLEGANDGKTELWLVRLPMLSEIESVVRYAHVSLNSNWATLVALNAMCQRLNTTHKVVLMQDLGDLREGLWDPQALIDLGIAVERQLEHLVLYGIGTNLGCYGAILPTAINLGQLVDTAEGIERAIGRPLHYISGGATTTYPLVLSGDLPSRINHLRIGEGILLSRDLKDYFGWALPTMYSDGFLLRAQIIEVEDKPSYPVGPIFVDAFGNIPQYQDIGIRRRALLAVGKQDIGDHSKISCVSQGVSIVGSSSDHLIVDITESPTAFAVGDVLSFNLYYPALLYLSSNRAIAKVYL